MPGIYENASTMPESEDTQFLTETDNIIDKHNCEKGLLISILQDIQEQNNYLPKETLIRVSEKLNIPLIQVYSVATFFKAFTLQPRGKNIIKVCVGTACHVRDSATILDKIERELDIKAGETTKDMMFTLETVNCLGACALGPIVVVNNEYHGQVTLKKVEEVLKKYETKKQVIGWLKVSAPCIYCGKSMMDEDFIIDEYPSVKVIIESEGERGELHLSSLYGSYNVESNIELQDGKIFRFYCPHCEQELTSTRLCDKCNAPMVAFKFVGGGTIKICSRYGCKKHYLEFEDIETELRAFLETYSSHFRGLKNE